MKLCLFKLFFLVSISFCMNSFADCSHPGAEKRFMPCPKTYIQPDQISISENAIFVQIHDVIIQTESLSSDEQGIYFANAYDEDCGLMQWKCTKRLDWPPYGPCNTCNWIWYNNCTFCKKFRWW